jgi:hypothetical protein
MDSHRHAARIRKRGHSGNVGSLAKRRPLLLLRLSVSFLLRLAERNLIGLLFHEPPRNTRRSNRSLPFSVKSTEAPPTKN